MTNDTVLVYGFSDDLIELEGAIEDEILCNYSEDINLQFDEGTTLRFHYTGEWKATVLVQGTAEIEIVPSEGQDSDNYSDRVTLRGVTRLVYHT